MYYYVTDLNGDPVVIHANIRKVALCLGVSVDTIRARLVTKVTKYSEFKGEKYKFNVRKCNELS